jgi:hypothetical protein
MTKQNKDGQEFIEYFSPNVKISDLEIILRDYYSHHARSESVFVSHDNSFDYITDTQPGKIGSVVIAQIPINPLNIVYIMNVLIEGSKTTVGIIEFRRVANKVRVRFTIFREIYKELIYDFISDFSTLSSKICCPLIKVEDLDSYALGDVYKTKRGMSEWRLRRANLFKELKDKEPSLSRPKLAKKATEVAYKRIQRKLEEDQQLVGERLEKEVIREFKKLYSHEKDEFTEEDVKNDYRDMRWKWDNSRTIT